MSIGDRIRKKRKEKKFTQSELANLVSVSSQVISNWERCYTDPSHDDVARLAKALDCSSDFLLGTEVKHQESLTFNEYEVLKTFPHDFQEYIKNSKDINELFKQSFKKYLTDFTNEQGEISKESKQKLFEVLKDNNIKIDFDSEHADTLNSWLNIFMNTRFSFKLFISFFIYEKQRYSSVSKSFDKKSRTIKSDLSEKDEKDIAKRLEQIRKDIEGSDGLAFDGEPLSDEAKESVMEAMEFIVRQTKKINEKFTPKQYRKKKDDVSED